jgi:MinD-like ATPase involved in chromosome partitioning or flagellar assembly
MTVGVLCAVRGAAEAAIVQAVDGTGGRLTVTRRCADLAELLAAAEAGLGRIAVVSADLPMLDRDAVAALHRSGVRLVGLGDPGAPWLGERITALGADLVVDTPDDAAGAAELVRDVVEVLGRAADHPGRPDAAQTDRHGLGPSFDPPGLEPAGVDPPSGRSRRTELGRVVAVWGPTGAPGRTTVAVNLAAELALLGGHALLVDADTYGGTIAQAVGLLDEAPGLAAATRAAGQGGLDTELLARLSPLISPDLRVLSGISRADRWPELPSAALDVVWTVARTLAASTVIDCGFCIEQDEVLSYDTRAPRRNAATLSALGDADEVIVVGAGDPLGVQRLVRALGDLAQLGLAGRTTVVVNQVRASVAGPRPGEAITAALERYAGVSAPHLVPEDRSALDAALLHARLLHELAPTSPARRAIMALALRLADRPRPAGLARPDGAISVRSGVTESRDAARLAGA